MSFVIYMGVFVLCCFGISLVQRFESGHYFSWNGNKIKKDNLLRFILRIIVLLPVLLLYTLRGVSVGTDTATYGEYYQYIKNFAVEHIFNYFIEPGYVLLSMFSDRVFGNEIGMHFLSGCLIFGMLTAGIMYYRGKLNEEQSVFIFFMSYFAIACNGIRQMIASCIIFYGVRYILEKKFWKYMLVVLVATLFHKTAVICVLFYALSLPMCVRNSGLVRKFILTIGILVLPFVNIVVKIVSSVNFYGEYIQRVTIATWGELKFLVYLIPEFILIFLLSRKNIKITPDIEILTNIFWMQIPFQFMQVYLEDISRIAWYCSFVKVLLVPRLLYGLDKRQRRTWNMVVCCWYLIYYLIMFVILNGHGTYPYVFYWNE